MENMTHKPDAVEWTEMHFINPHAKGVLCFCGADATHKVGEEIPRDDPYQNRHNFTQYVCCQCFVNIVGNAAFCGLTRDTAERDALRREAEAGKQAAQIGLDTLIAMRDADYRGNRPTSSESAFHAVKAINKALEGESK